ncbi:MAG: DEAD/DEAH box helicase [Pseudomonadota bacterium]
MSSQPISSFSDLALSPEIFQALEKVGYEHPSPIQSKTIPLLLAGKDLIGQAQTGTGKTAAFALPLLSQLDIKQKDPQVLVLAPTRELAIQVAEAFQTYATFMKGFHVLPVYGGQDFRTQLNALKRGAHVIVGTPGRVMDHMRRGTLNLSGLKTIVLDEADEMLRMGFIDDVQWILEQAPEKRQIALFSATMPPQIRKIASQHLREPEHVTIEVKTASAETIRQRYWPVRGINKLDALTRILEAEVFTAMLVFVRTKTSTVELSDKLSARGFAASAINGDMSQQLRESTIDKLRNGKLDILVATDVAARGLDVERISHVINYDIPYDVETYIHRIGRTGRAGREGDAILFAAPREQRMLFAIEKATRKKIEMMELPSTDLINDRRTAKFMQQITDVLAGGGLEQYQQLIERYEQEKNVPAQEIAAALARLLQGDNPLFLEKSKTAPASEKFRERNDDSAGGDSEWKERKPARSREGRSKEFNNEGGEGEARTERPRARRSSESNAVEAGMTRYRIEVGNMHDIKPGNIVGAIANEAGIASAHIGRINIFDDYSLVDLPEGMPKETLMHLKRVWVGKQQMNITRVDGGKASVNVKNSDFTYESSGAPEKGNNPDYKKSKAGDFTKGKSAEFRKNRPAEAGSGKKPDFKKDKPGEFSRDSRPAFKSGAGKPSSFIDKKKPRKSKPRSTD